MKKRYADVRRALHLRWLGKPSIRPHEWDEWDAHKRDISREAVYNHLPAVPIDTSAKLTTETESAKTLLLDNLSTLRDRLGEQNIRMTRFEVEVKEPPPGGGLPGAGGR